MKITDKGQVTIPVRIRKKMGLLPNTDVEFIISGGHVVLSKAAKANRRGKKLIAVLRGRAPKGGMSTDEIMALTRGE